MKQLRLILVALGVILLVTNTALALTITEDFSSALINKSDLTTSTGLNQWNDLVRWQINPGEWAQHTPGPGPEESLLFYGFDATGLGAGTAFSLDFDFINESSSFNGTVYLGGLVGGESISRFAPWANLSTTFFDSATINTVNTWTAFTTFSGIIDADYDVLYMAFKMGGTDQLRGIDNVNLQVGTEPVPEPSTILLLGSGLAGLAFVARRRKKE